MKVSAIVIGVLSLSASALAQTAPAPTPASTKTGPAPTPAATNNAPAPTPASTNNKAPVAVPGSNGKLWEVSVERDATFTIEGPICSGSGAKPAGTKCPKKGDIATDRCLKYLPSYNKEAGKCIAPVDSECKVIKTGAWGCVWPAGSQAAADAAKITDAPSKDSTKPGATTKPGVTTKPTTPTAKPTTKPGNGTGNSTDTIVVPGNSTRARLNPEDIVTPSEANTFSGAEAVGAATSSTGTIAGVIAVVAGVACAVTGTIIYRRKKAETAEATALESAIRSPGAEAYTHNGVRA